VGDLAFFERFFAVFASSLQKSFAADTIKCYRTKDTKFFKITYKINANPTPRPYRLPAALEGAWRALKGRGSLLSDTV